MDRQLEFVAHRGYAAVYPENTLPALQAAVDAGARFVEIDVQLTRDGVPVMLHDATLSRTAQDPRSIHELDASDLAELDVGYAERFGTQFAGTAISSVAEVAAWLAASPGVQLFVEIKQESISAAGLAALFDGLLPALGSVLERCIIISFNDAALRESRQRCAARIGWVLPDWSDSVRETLEALQPAFVFCDVKKLPPGDGVLWRGSWEWVIYEVTEPSVARQLHRRGVGMIETMEIAHMLQAPDGSHGRD